MALTELPEKTDESIGRAKTDLGAAPNLDNYVPAEEYERLKTFLIDVCEEVGVHAGDAGDLNTRVNTLDSAVSTLGGDLSGALSAAVVAGLQGRPVANTAPSSNQVLTWNGSAWAPAAAGASTLQQAYTAGRTISVTSGVGSVLIQGTADGDATTLLTLTRNHLTGAAGKLLEGTMHAAATGSGIHVHQSASATARGFHVDGVGSNAGLRVEGAGTLDVGSNHINLASGSTWSLQIGGTAKLALNATGVLISSSQKLQINDNGNAGAPQLYFAAIGNTHGFYALPASAPQPARVGIAADPGLMAAEFGSRTGASSGTSILSRIQFTDATTLTAGWTALEISRLGTGTGSGTKRMLSLVNGSEIVGISDTGQITAPAGSLSAPTYSFGGTESDSGLLSDGTDQVAISAGGSRIARFRLVGAVGTVQVANGNAANPGVAFVSATGSGFFRTSDNVGVSIAGTHEYTFSATAFAPAADNVNALGTVSERFSNVFAASTTIGDLVMSNVQEGGTAAWLLREGDDELFAFNLRTKKKYRLAMVEVEFERGDDARMEKAAASIAA